MSIPTTDQVATRITAALAARAQAKPSDPSDNPLVGKAIVDLMHGDGVRSGADQYPAVDLTPRGGMATDMERVRKAGLKAGKIDRSAQRMKTARARAERKAQFDAIAASKKKPSKNKLAAAWEIVLPLEPIIAKGALSKKAWATRFLGSAADDLPSMVLESTVLVLAKSNGDLTLLAKAARELGGQMERTGRMPGNQLTDEQRKERREMAKARKWLMGLINNRIMGALVDTYTSQQNLRWHSLDVIATIMANISGPADDAFISRFKADRAPAFLGTRFQRPNGIDGNLLAMSVAAAITDRGLDRLVELLLDTENVRTDGSFSWAEHAEEVFTLSPEGGEWAWGLVVSATEHLADPRAARADAARTHVRNVFAWLPGQVVDTVGAFDFQATEHHTHGYHAVWAAPATATVTLSATETRRWAQCQRRADGSPVKGRKAKSWSGEEIRTVTTEVVVTRRVRVKSRAWQSAVMSSPFEARLCSAGRRIYTPALSYATPKEAARAITEHLAMLTTGEDLVKSMVFA